MHGRACREYEKLPGSKGGRSATWRRGKGRLRSLEAHRSPLPSSLQRTQEHPLRIEAQGQRLGSDLKGQLSIYKDLSVSAGQGRKRAHRDLSPS